MNLCVLGLNGNTGKGGETEIAEKCVG